MTKMQWSKLKKHVEEHFADSIQGRVGLHTTRYRTMHDHDGRAWITLDRKEIINMVHIWKWLYEVERRAAALAGIEFKWNAREARHLEKEAERSLEQESFFTQVHLGDAMHQYLSMSFADILRSENPVVQALGMVDRRLGVRRIRTMNPEGMHPLVKTLFLFRREAEQSKIQRKQKATSETPNQAL